MEENKLIAFLGKHSTKLIICFLCIIPAILFIDRSNTSKKQQKIKDFVVMRQIAENCVKGEPLSVESLKDMEKLLKKHPQLHAKYDHLLTLCLFQQENTSKSLVYGNAALKRVAAMAPSMYQDFSKTSLLITQKKYQEALDQALALENRLNSEDSVLRAFNLVRIASLSKELNQTSSFEKATAQLETLPSFSQIAPLFEEKAFTWKDYLNLASQ